MLSPPAPPPPRAPAGRRDLLLWAGLLALFAGLRAAHTWLASYDDAYITYVFARSFAAGEGLAWHGERVLGTSSPFTAVLLGLVSRATGLAVPVAGHLLSWVALWGTGIALLILARRQGIPRAGPVAALLWMIAPAAVAHLGSELLPAIACVAGAAAAFAAGRDRMAGLLLAAAFAFRAEAGLAAPLLALGLAASRGLAAAWRRVARAAAVALAASALWLASLAVLQGGALLPRTLAAKQAQAASSLGIWPGGWAGLAPAAGRAIELLPGPIPLAVLGLALLGLAGLARLRPRPALLLALLAWGPLHLLLVALLGVGLYPWYALPFQFALLLLIATAPAAPAGGGRAGPAREAAAWLLLGTLVGLELQRQDPARPFRLDSRQEAYGRAAALFDRYPEASRVAAYEVGFLGWASARPVADLLGLVSPEVSLDFVRAGDLATARRQLDPDLLMLPLAGGSLFSSTVGDARAFVADFRLDRLQLDSEPRLALFRHRRRAPRGEVLADLLPLFAAAETRVTLVERERLSALALVLGRGEERTAALPPLPATALHLALGPFLGESARLSIDLAWEGGGEPLPPLRARGSERWRGFALPLPALPEPGARLRFRCEPEEAGHCLVAFPWLGAPETG